MDSGSKDYRNDAIEWGTCLVAQTCFWFTRESNFPESEICLSDEQTWMSGQGESLYTDVTFRRSDTKVNLSFWARKLVRARPFLHTSFGCWKEVCRAAGMRHEKTARMQVSEAHALLNRKLLLVTFYWRTRTNQIPIPIHIINAIHCWPEFVFCYCCHWIGG